MLEQEIKLEEQKERTVKEKEQDRDRFSAPEDVSARAADSGSPVSRGDGRQ